MGACCCRCSDEAAGRGRYRAANANSSTHAKRRAACWLLIAEHSGSTKTSKAAFIRSFVHSCMNEKSNRHRTGQHTNTNSIYKCWVAACITTVLLAHGRRGAAGVIGLSEEQDAPRNSTTASRRASSFIHGTVLVLGDKRTGPCLPAAAFPCASAQCLSEE